jgi:hypothetical protein
MSEHEHNELPESRVDFPGPFTHHDVVVSGWKVPLLQAQVSDDESRVMLVLDDRFALDLTVEEAERVVPFLADAMAVALGYDAHPTESDDPPLRRAPHPKPQRTLSIAQWGDD